MGELRSVPDLLARSDRSFARTQHRLRTIKFWILGLFGCLYVGSLVFYAVSFVAVWHEGDWLSYWAAFLGVGPLGLGFARVALSLACPAVPFRPPPQVRQPTRAACTTRPPPAR